MRGCAAGKGEVVLWLWAIDERQPPGGDIAEEAGDQAGGLAVGQPLAVALVDAAVDAVPCFLGRETQKGPWAALAGGPP